MDDILESIPFKIRPKVVQCDNGSEFDKTFENHLHDIHDVKVVHSAPYKPQTNGNVERTNKTIESKIYYHMTQNGTRRWVDILDLIVENMNNSKNTTTKHTPLEIIQKKEIRNEVK